MNEKFIGPMKAAMLAAFIVGTATYLADKSNPILAGLLVTIPVALPSIWFIDNDISLKEYTWSFALGILIYFMVILLFYNLVIHREIDRKKGIIMAMGVWVLIMGFVYLVITNKGYR